MSLVVISQPESPLVSLDEVKAHLRVEDDDDDTMITGLIHAAITEFEDPNLGWLGRSLSQRELELRLERFPCHRHICLPRGPLFEDPQDGYAVEVKYDDPAGVEQTLAGTVYRLLDPETVGARLALRVGQNWPATLWSGCDSNAVRISYTAGYATDDKRLEAFKAAVMLHVEMNYDGDTERFEKLRGAIDRLLQPYRVYSL